MQRTDLAGLFDTLTGEIPQVFPPVEIRAPHDPRRCPQCGYQLREGDWPFCRGGVGHEPVQQGVGHPVVCKW